MLRRIRRFARALRDGGGLLRPGGAVILTVWEAVATRLATGSFGFTAGVSYLPDETELDAREEAAARQAVAGGVEIAERHGWEATARVERAVEPVWQTVVWVAEAIDASLIVCGARGRNAAKRALVGSVAESVLHHSHRPTLIAPQPHVE